MLIHRNKYSHAKANFAGLLLALFIGAFQDF